MSPVGSYEFSRGKRPEHWNSEGQSCGKWPLDLVPPKKGLLGSGENLLLSVFKKWRDGKGFPVLISLTSLSDYLALIEGLKLAYGTPEPSEVAFEHSDSSPRNQSRESCHVNLGG